MEDYSKARTLATFEYLGETFRVVRRRFGGKHWRNHLMILHDGMPITNDFRYWSSTDPATCAQECLRNMQGLNKDEFAKGLATIHNTELLAP